MKRGHVLAGLSAIGVSTLLAMPLPSLGAHAPPPEVLRVLILIQPCVLVAIALAIGLSLAPRLGLGSPLIDALIARQPASSILRSQLVMAVPLGVLCAVLIVLFSRAVWSQLPERFVREATAQDAPLLVRVGYGGICEEIMLRWGFMSLVVFALWKLWPGKPAAAPNASFVLAILISALMFGAGHLPIAAYYAGGLTRWLVAFVILGNASFGLVAGWLYWRKGIEAAMFAHVATGAVLYAASDFVQQ
jgi:hypothetical protein